MLTLLSEKSSYGLGALGPLPVPTAVTNDCDGYLPVVPSSFLNKLLTW